MFSQKRISPVGEMRITPGSPEPVKCKAASTGGGAEEGYGREDDGAGKRYTVGLEWLRYDYQFGSTAKGEA